MPMIPPDETFPDRLKAAADWMGSKIKERLREPRKLPSQMTDDELVDFASNFAAPMGTVRNVAKKAAKAALPRLSALHNTNAQKLQQSLDMGGMPVPSVAVVPEHIPFDEFGDITLIGKKSLGDPKTSRVFSDDVYSPTVPAPAYKKPPRKALQDTWKGTTGQYGNRFEDDAFRYAEDGDFSEAMRIAYRSDGLKQAWAKSRGIQGDGSAISDVLHSDPERLKDFSEFVRQSFAPVMSEPLVKAGGKALPYNLDNVAQAMGKNAKNAQQTMVYGPGKVRSAHATQFKDLEKMRAAAASGIRPNTETRPLAEAARQRLVDAAGEIAPHSQYSTWTGMDDAMKAFSAPRKVPLGQSLARVDIRDVPPEKIAAAEKALDEFLSVPTNYFESKPARGVRFDEFAGAVLPESAPETIAEALRQRGLLVERYSDPAARASLVHDLRKRLNDSGAGTLFQLLAGVGIGGAALSDRREGKQVLRQ